MNRPRHCVQRTNIQNLKAIHNRSAKQVYLGRIVFKERIYKIWKQFTTREYFERMSETLCSKNEYTKSESNSQLLEADVKNSRHCVQRTNIQNLKAIHNIDDVAYICAIIVFKERIYKIWKQFTTRWMIGLRLVNCVQRTNIQNLKAIHNRPAWPSTPPSIVFKERIYKIWKQFTTCSVGGGEQRVLCSKNEYTKSESNSQRPQVQFVARCIVFKERIYKIWKQFTTHQAVAIPPELLCSKNEYTKSESNSQHYRLRFDSSWYCVQRTNIQNLKAIHNYSKEEADGKLLCSKNEYTKSESNSQRQSCWFCPWAIVFKERIYKIWKQFTTILLFSVIVKLLCSKNEYTKSESNSQHGLQGFVCNKIVFKERIYKIWKQFTTWNIVSVPRPLLCSKNEYTKSESNSQQKRYQDQPDEDCVQRTNIQNLKAIHNQNLKANFFAVIVFKERIYKIWKQFTTVLRGPSLSLGLCSKNEYTKSESNSQRTGTPIWLRPGGGCMCSGCGASLFWNGLTISLRSYHETTRLS